jgi:hypothetical protein
MLRISPVIRQVRARERPKSTTKPIPPPVTVSEVNSRTTGFGTGVLLPRTIAIRIVPLVAVPPDPIAGESQAKLGEGEMCTDLVQAQIVGRLTLVCQEVEYLRGFCVPRRHNVTQTHGYPVGSVDPDRCNGSEDHCHKPCRWRSDYGKRWSTRTAKSMEKRWSTCATKSMEKRWSACAAIALEIRVS